MAMRSAVPAQSPSDSEPSGNEMPPSYDTTMHTTQQFLHDHPEAAAAAVAASETNPELSAITEQLRAAAGLSASASDAASPRKGRPRPATSGGRGSRRSLTAGRGEEAGETVHVQVLECEELALPRTAVPPARGRAAAPLRPVVHCAVAPAGTAADAVPTMGPPSAGCTAPGSGSNPLWAAGGGARNHLVLAVPATRVGDAPSSNAAAAPGAAWEVLVVVHDETTGTVLGEARLTLQRCRARARDASWLAWHALRRPGDDPQPAGRVKLSLQAIAAPPPRAQAQPPAAPQTRAPRPTTAGHGRTVAGGRAAPAGHAAPELPARRPPASPITSPRGGGARASGWADDARDTPLGDSGEEEAAIAAAEAAELHAGDIDSLPSYDAAPAHAGSPAGWAATQPLALTQSLQRDPARAHVRRSRTAALPIATRVMRAAQGREERQPRWGSSVALSTRGGSSNSRSRRRSSDVGGTGTRGVGGGGGTVSLSTASTHSRTGVEAGPSAGSGSAGGGIAVFGLAARTLRSAAEEEQRQARRAEAQARVQMEQALRLQQQAGATAAARAQHGAEVAATLLLRDAEEVAEHDRKVLRARRQREWQLQRRILCPNKQADHARQPGPVIGPGPLPPDPPQPPPPASRFVWDEHGRRQPAPPEAEPGAGADPLQRVLYRLRRFAATAAGVDLRGPFRQFDTDGDGALSRHEFAAALQAMGVRATAEEAEAVAAHFDSDGDGRVQFGEFLFAFFNQRQLAERWRKFAEVSADARAAARGTLGRPGGEEADAAERLFRRHDHMRDGLISREAFRAALRASGLVAAGWQEEVMMDHFAPSPRGELVDYRAFLRFIREETAGSGAGGAGGAARGAPGGRTHAGATQRWAAQARTRSADAAPLVAGSRASAALDGSSGGGGGGGDSGAAARALVEGMLAEQRRVDAVLRGARA